jgi:hypothetical protein
MKQQPQERLETPTPMTAEVRQMHQQRRIRMTIGETRGRHDGGTERGLPRPLTQREFLSSHKLALFRQDPTLYAASMAGTMREPEREAFTVGSATHTLILEGREAFDREYIVGGPVNEKTGKTYGRDTAIRQVDRGERQRPARTR